MSALAAACAVGKALAPSGGTAGFAAGFAAGFGVEAVCAIITGAPNRPRASAAMARRRAAIERAAVENVCGLVIGGYLRRPPPPERARDAPTLADPRWLLRWAALLLGRLLEAPPKALPFRLEYPWLLGTLRLPTRSARPALAAPRFAPALLVAGDAPARFVPAPLFRVAPPADGVRVDAPGVWRAVACRV